MSHHSRRRRAALALAALLGTVVAGPSLGALTAPAHATTNPVPPLLVDFDAAGTSVIAKTGGTVRLGPTTLSVALDPVDGTFTGHLPLPRTRTSFKAVGVLPTTATVGFVEAAPVTGRLTTTGGRSTVTSTASFYITLRNIKTLGLPLVVGSRCRTSAPVSIPADTPPGQSFDLTTGGRLTGTYTIGDFANCGLATVLINLLIPGSGNTVDLQVSNGRVVG